LIFNFILFSMERYSRGFPVEEIEP
jgi:hypothetical protein